MSTPGNVIRESLNQATDTLFPLIRKLLNRLPEWTNRIVDLARQVTPVQAGVGGFIAYLVLVRALRWRRYNAIHKKYEEKWRNGDLTPEEAQKIIHTSVFYDMPLLLNYALAFALFKTYAVPSVSKLLLSTKELGTEANVARRYADTEILIATWVGCPVSGFIDPEAATKNQALENPQPAEDSRAMLALARVNWIHSHYRISNDDYLYTLSLFVLEPGRWAGRYGWRALSPMEKDAFFILWLDIGKKMCIKDIPETLEELTEWSQAYEERAMVPAESNLLVAQHTTNELIAAVPGFLKPFARNTTTCLLEDRTRIAMMQEAQPAIHHALVKLLLYSTGFVQKWLMLPRTDSNFWFPIDVRIPKLDASGRRERMHPSKYMSRPWYKAERRGVFRVFDKFLVSIGWYKELPCEEFRSSGYRIDQMGPLRFENVGQEVVFEQAAMLQRCPVGREWFPLDFVHNKTQTTPC